MEQVILAFPSTPSISSLLHGASKNVRKKKIKTYNSMSKVVVT